MSETLPALPHYDAACQALAKAVRVDEARDIRNKSLAMQVYAEQAKNHSLMQDAITLRLRAERRIGELLREMKERGERHDGKGQSREVLRSHDATVRLPKLADLGITKTQSSHWQRLASLSDEGFKQKLAETLE